VLQEGLMAVLSFLTTSIVAAFLAVGSPFNTGDALGGNPRPRAAGLGYVHAYMGDLVTLSRAPNSIAANDAAARPAPETEKRAPISAECASLIPQLTIGAARDGASADLLDIAVRASSSMFPDDHAIAGSLADLSALRGRPVLSHVALRERLYIQGPAAVRAALYDSASVWAPLLSLKSRLFIALGVSAPPEETVSEIAVRNAIGLVDRGQLREALFELTASTPDVQKYLSVWIAEARLRLAYDAAIGVLLKHVIRRCNETSVN
jgi:hypothetical protein